MHGNITGSFIKRLYRVTHFVTFLCNTIKKSKVILLTKKNEILSAFKGYCLYYKREKKRFRRLYTDKRREFDFHRFIKF